MNLEISHDDLSGVILAAIILLIIYGLLIILGYSGLAKPSELIGMMISSL